MQVEAEWRVSLVHLPQEAVVSVLADFASADMPKRKRMLWDVRKFIAEESAAHSSSPVNLSLIHI